MSIKKVVIAAAGQGTRMLALSNDKSKHLICVNNKPFLAYLMDQLVKAGYDDIVLVVGFKKELMEDFTKDYLSGQKNVKIQIVDQHEILGPKEKEYGTACPIKCVKDIVGNENFIYVYGDNLFSVDDLKSMNIDDEFCYIAGLKQEHPEKYGVLIEDGDDFLEEIIEKPKEFVGNLINAGLYKFTPEVFEKINQIQKSPRGEYEITDVISLLAKEKRVKIKKIKDYWHDFGNPEDVEKLSKFIKDGCNKVESKSSK
jgi:bifunctional UDP-N-acetylglucosamine pyrophosphorylase/glucosamine-1-phosphate N-acetyltransferase